MRRSQLFLFGLAASLVSAEPLPARSPKVTPYDVQGHRGGRGHTVENTLPSFAWGLINGATSLEMDNGITKDGHVIVWHDENIVGTKCLDTKPVTPNDPLFPYVGKFIANLTLAQIKTLDCGSIRQTDFPLQIRYPGTRLATLSELFGFLSCADPNAVVKLNIESKIDAQFPNSTVGVDEFVTKQHGVFTTAGEKYYKQHGAITYQSFDWRTLVAMGKLDKSLWLSALVDDTTAIRNSTWLAGIDPWSFPGPTLGEQITQAAHSFGAHILSPNAIATLSNTSDPTLPGFKEFTTLAMVQQAHKFGMQVKPWTVDNLDLVSRLVLDYKVDGIISDEPHDVRRWAKYEAQLPVARPFQKGRVLECLAKHNQVDSTSYLHSSS